MAATMSAAIHPARNQALSKYFTAHPIALRLPKFQQAANRGQSLRFDID